MVDQVQFGFAFGNVSKKVLGNIDQQFYSRCFYDGSNAMGKLQGSLVKRPSIKPLFVDEIDENLYEEVLEYRIFHANFKSWSLIFRFANLLPIDEIGMSMSPDPVTLLKIYNANTGEVVQENYLLPTYLEDLSLLTFANKTDFGVFAHPSAQPFFYADLDNSYFRKAALKDLSPFWRPINKFAPHLYLVPRYYQNLLGPVLDQNTEVTHTLTSDSNPEVGGTVTITASIELFLAGHLNSVWAITEPTGTLSPYPQWEANTSYSNGVFIRNEGRVYQAKTSGTSGNIPPAHDTDADVQSDGGVPWLFCNDGTGYFKITEVISATQVKGLVQRRIPQSAITTPTWRWNEAAWSGVRGYPSLVTLFEQRVVFAATEFSQQTLWTTRVGEEFNFFASSGSAQEEDSLTLTLFAGGRIVWILGAGQLFVGSTQKVFQFITLLGLLSQQIELSGEDASIGNQALFFNNMITYIGAKNRQLRMMAYREEYRAFVSSNPEFLNPEELTELQEITLLSSPKTVLGLKEISLGGVMENFTEIVAFQADIELKIFGMYNIKSEYLTFRSITSDRQKAFVAATQINERYEFLVGTFDPEREEKVLKDFDKYDYTMEASLPPPSIWAPPVYAGNLVKIQQLTVHFQVEDTGPFYVNDNLENTRDTQAVMDDYAISSSVVKIPLGGTQEVRLRSVEGAPFTLVTALYTFER